MHFVLSHFCHHGSGGAAVNSPSQQDPYLSPRKDFKLIASFVQELWPFKVELTNPDTARRSNMYYTVRSCSRTLVV
jgi:hypothetical protein